MNQVLQPAGFAFQQRQDLVGFPHLPHVVPGRTEHLGAVPDHAGEHHDDGRIQRGDRQDAPADRHRAHQPDDPGTALRGETRRPFHGFVVPRHRQGQFTPPREFVRSTRRRDRAVPCATSYGCGRSSWPWSCGERPAIPTAEAGGSATRRTMLRSILLADRRREIRARQRPSRPPSATARQRCTVRERPARLYTGKTHPLMMMSAAGKKGSTNLAECRRCDGYPASATAGVNGALR